MDRTVSCMGVVLAALMAAGCAPLRTEHKITSDPIRVEPIEINVNVRVKVDRQLDDFFGELDAKNQTIETTKEEKE